VRDGHKPPCSLVVPALFEVKGLIWLPAAHTTHAEVFPAAKSRLYCWVL
jgi:hypothetical protein